MTIGRCTATALIIRSLPVADGGTDTTRRVIKGQTVTLYGESYDDAWIYVDAPAGRGWVAKQYIEAISETIASPAWPKVPNGLEEIKALFGEPGKPLCYAGRARLPAPLKLSWEDTKITVFACHKLMEDVFTSVYQNVFDRGLWELLEDFGGCYNFRPVKSSSKISTHAWGISTDQNTKSNPLGAVPKMDRRLVAVFEDHGFIWGGNWSRPDGMHHQFAKGY